MLDMTGFYESVRGPLYKGSLPEWQAEPLRLIVAEGYKRERNRAETAYVLATAHHETGRFKHMEEIGRGEGRDYGEDVLLIRGERRRYHGRGFVQLTWLQNYARMSLLLGVNLVESPEQASKPDVAAAILWEGMIRGLFTGKSLADYRQGDSLDFVQARRIVNGTDRADLIASYATVFHDALGGVVEADEPTGCPRPDCPMKGTV
jgi:putative chitinase